MPATAKHKLTVYSLIKKARRGQDLDSAERVQREQVGIARYYVRGASANGKFKELCPAGVPDRMPDAALNRVRAAH